MTTVLDICTRAMRRGGITDSLHSPAAEEARDAVAALNEMLYGWKAQGCDLLLQAEWVSSDTFYFWIPPAELASSVIDVLDYRGTWNASTNSPSLASATGTKGYVYRVSTAGSTTLDDVTSWSANDYAVYTGTEWLKSLPEIIVRRHVIALLAQRLCDEYGMPIAQQLAIDARDGWQTIQSFYVKPPTAGFDQALRDVPSRTLTVSYEEESAS